MIFKTLLSLCFFFNALLFSVSGQEVTVVTKSIDTTFREDFLFDPALVDSNTIILARSPQYDSTRPYRSFNFFISDSAKIREMLLSLPLGEKVNAMHGDPSFLISIVKGHKEVKRWTLIPSAFRASSHNHGYKLDMVKVKGLNAHYPFEYKVVLRNFKDSLEYALFINEQKKDSNFLFAYSPLFRHEGSFHISFPRNNTFKSPSAVFEWLEPRVKKIMGNKQPGMAYPLDEENLNNPDQFTVRIEGSRKLFDLLDTGKYKKKDWIPMENEATLFYRVNNAEKMNK